MPEIELPTDEELQHWDALAERHVVNQPLPVIPSEQGQAVAELARAVPRMLRLIAVERQDEAVRLEAE